MDKCAARTLYERMNDHGSTKDDRIHVYLLWKERAEEHAGGTPAARKMPAQAGKSAALVGGESDVLRKH